MQAFSVHQRCVEGGVLHVHDFGFSLALSPLTFNATSGAEQVMHTVTYLLKRALAAVFDSIKRTGRRLIGPSAPSELAVLLLASVITASQMGRESAFLSFALRPECVSSGSSSNARSTHRGSAMALGRLRAAMPSLRRRLKLRESCTCKMILGSRA